MTRGHLDTDEAAESGGATLMEFVIIVIAVCALRVMTNLLGYDNPAALHLPEEGAGPDAERRSADAGFEMDPPAMYEVAAPVS